MNKDQATRVVAAVMASFPDAQWPKATAAMWVEGGLADVEYVDGMEAIKALAVEFQPTMFEHFPTLARVVTRSRDMRRRRILGEQQPQIPEGPPTTKPEARRRIADLRSQLLQERPPADV